MPRSDKRAKRAYHAPRREAAAARTREAIVRAAKELFEERGWAGTTVGAIGDAADVSQKTVEAIFRTKAALLQATVDYAIRGDVDPLPMPQRRSVAQMEAAPDAATMLKLHAAHLRAINQRSARLAWAVEHAAAADPTVAALWERMNHNRSFGVRWATGTLLGKPGRKRGLTRRQVEVTFWVALDWGTYRTLTEQAGLAPDQFEQWLRRYYEATLLAARTT
jgi:AcrR family transcriptional regulator